MTKYLWRWAAVAVLGMGLAGCGTLGNAGAARTPILAAPPAFPGVTALSLRPFSPELQGFVQQLTWSPGGALSVLAHWTNVPDSLTQYSWRLGSPSVQSTPFTGVDAASLSRSGSPVIAGINTRGDYLADGQIHHTWSAPVTWSAGAVAESSGAVYAVGTQASGIPELVQMQGSHVRVWPLPQIKGTVAALAAGPQSTVWIGESHPDRVWLWHGGTLETSYAEAGTVMALEAPQFLPAPQAVLAEVATPSAFPETGNQLVEISAQAQRTVAINPAWLVPPDAQPFAGGMSQVDWSGPNSVFATLWDAGLNQVAIAHADLHTGLVTILPHSNFSPSFPSGQPPVFPICATPAGVLAVGQGYGVAFYSPSKSDWFQFIK